MAANQLTQAQQQAQLNATARALIKARSVPMCQQIFGQSGIVPANTPQVVVQPRNVGLITGFWVKVVHTCYNNSGTDMDLSDFGPANAISLVQFNDLNNNTRHQSTGWHFAFLNSCRSRRPFGTALIHTTGFDDPINFGSNWNVISLRDSITGANEVQIADKSTGILTMWYFIPMAYSKDDLRGSIYANVVNATMQLILGLPGSNGVVLAVANGTDSTLAMFVGDKAGAVAGFDITNTALTVYQEYYDQLPMGPQGVILPITDLATIYELKSTIQTNIPQNQDFGFQYPNFRDFISTFMVYVNTGASGARGVGGDINYLSLQSANFTNIWKEEPALLALRTRQLLQTDLPPGVYYLPSGQRPISTTQYGNMELILNASTAAAGNYQLVGTEDLALIQQLSMAGSLPTS